ncbi:pyridoxamine 5'-phosphate oxidase family protein [Spiractinospora alimapuensis]|uniref:pyridoxamine 5'-phosphate oxidase family protein n=1 Tax=Spiractinospora alimapuensis TaxID=2820884 RepID=UPI001F2E67AC|nr:pyridoxamine 5'-phosphate oxidase family protein [Spiractinospora alimapuensis]QVQ51594.1 pyridoxamine 5'-phosphate oxidase family protein [Spiractinospora alimapuensis]
MAKLFEALTGRLREFIEAQPVFFVGTAPLDEAGHINVSPKGMAGTFAITGPRQVAYLDYSGSGAETIAHLRENGRIVFMFCAFDGPPNIVRLHGTGRAVFTDDPEFARLRAVFPKERTLGQRSIVVADLHRISDSCGYSVPLMEFKEDRDVLDRHQGRRDPEYFPKKWRDQNAVSLDGLPAVPVDDPYVADS